MLSYQNKLLYKKNRSYPSLHGTSYRLLISKHGKRVCRTIPFCNSKGSATVEAALVVPIFLFAAFAVYTLMNILIAKDIVYEGLQETAQYLAEYQYIESVLSDEEAEGASINFGGTNAVTAKIKLKEYIDDDELIEKYVSGGISGLNFTAARYEDGDGYIFLELTYNIAVDIPIVGSVSLKESEQIKQKAYVGLQYEDLSDDGDVYVYVTENGTVYHKDRSCYHIKLTITQIDENTLNSMYSGYDACEICAAGKTMTGSIYITKTGDKYHYSIGCSGLKRTVKRVKLKDVSNLSPCSACGS